MSSLPICFVIDIDRLIRTIRILTFLSSGSNMMCRYMKTSSWLLNHSNSVYFTLKRVWYNWACNYWYLLHSSRTRMCLVPRHTLYSCLHLRMRNVGGWSRLEMRNIVVRGPARSAWSPPTHRGMAGMWLSGD